VDTFTPNFLYRIGYLSDTAIWTVMELNYLYVWGWLVGGGGSTFFIFLLLLGGGMIPHINEMKLDAPPARDRKIE
jgi:hypothetical protein